MPDPRGLTDNRIPPWQRAWALAWPVAAQQGLGLAVGLSDRWIAGHAGLTQAGEELALQAAQTTCFYLSWMIGAVGVLATAGVSAIVSRETGSGDDAGPARVVHQGLLIALLAGLGGAAAGWAGLESLLGALQLDGRAGGLGREYLAVTFALLPIQLMGGTAVVALAAAGDTGTPLRIALGTTLINLPLAWIGFHGVAGRPGLGFVGIAWGTGIAQAIGTLAVLGCLIRGRAGLRLSLEGFRPDVPLIRRILRISLPAAMESLSMVAGQMLFLAAVNGLGDAARAGHGIALGWESVAETLGLAFAVAAGPLVGQNLGAGRPDEARRCGLAALGLAAFGMSLAGVCLHGLAEPLFTFYCPGESQRPIVAVGVPVLRLAAFSMPALAACHVLGAALRGAGDTCFPLLVTWLGFFLIRLPLTWWLSRSVISVPWGDLAGWGQGLYGCWMAMQIDLWVRGGLLVIRFVRGRWQSVRV
jgi:putative MATE family efflux protein